MTVTRISLGIGPDDSDPDHKKHHGGTGPHDKADPKLQSPPPPEPQNTRLGDDEQQ